MSMAFAPGLPSVMAPVNMPSYGPDVGYSAVTGGYNSGAGLAPLADPYAGQGYGIYNDASMYRGGDFWGGGSDPYAGAPGWNGEGSNATPYDNYGGLWGVGDGTPGYTIPYSPSAPARGSAEWYGGGWDMIPDTMGGQGYGFAPYPVGGGGGGGGYDSGIAPDMSGGQGYGGYQPPAYSSGIPPDTSGGQGYGGYQPYGGLWGVGDGTPGYGDYSSARDFRGGMSAAEWYGAGYDMIPGAPSYGDYSSGRDFTGGGGYGGGGGGGGGQAAPPFDYNAMNSPSFDGNWGDAAFMARPGNLWGVGDGTPGYTMYSPNDYSSARDFLGMSSAEFYGTGYDMMPREQLAQLLDRERNVEAGGGSSHAETTRPPSTRMQVGPEDYPPTPFGGGFNNRPPTYNNQNEFTQPGTGTIMPPGSQPWMFPGYTPQGSGIPGVDPSWNGDPGTSGMPPEWGGLLSPEQRQRMWLEMNQGA